jgi:Raf kinase inhibitor-like YbhB/YbcL family protein
MGRTLERFMGRLLAGRHAGDQRMLSRSPGLAEVPATIELTSPAFAPGSPIPTRYTQEGDDRFPPLAWRGVPGSAQELVIVIEDPDAPLPLPVVHAIVHGLPARADGLDEAEVNAPGFAGFGKNSRGARSYRGPRPILGHGPHRYVFQLFALAQPLRLAGPPTKKTLRAALSGGGVLARGELVGTYERR